MSEITALLGNNSAFEGKLVFEGTVRIDGRFKGDIVSRDTLVIGPSARVVGQVEADIVVVAGYFEGQLRCTSRVEIQPTGSVKGFVSSPVFKIEEGGVFEGTTQMTG